MLAILSASNFFHHAMPKDDLNILLFFYPNGTWNMCACSEIKLLITQPCLHAMNVIKV